MPVGLEGRVELAKTRTGWAFDWAGSRVLYALHCEAEPAFERPFDLLLVSGSKVVYVTSGFAGGLPGTDAVVTDANQCPGNPLDAPAGPARSPVRASGPMGTASARSD